MMSMMMVVVNPIVLPCIPKSRHRCKQQNRQKRMLKHCTGLLGLLLLLLLLAAALRLQ